MKRFLTTTALALLALAPVALLAPTRAHAQVTVYYGPPVVTYSIPAPPPPPVYYVRPVYTYYVPPPVTTVYVPTYTAPTYSYYTRTRVKHHKIRVRYYGPYYTPPALTYRPTYYAPPVHVP
jgi:hypothetical protein